LKGTQKRAENGYGYQQFLWLTKTRWKIDKI